MLSNYPGPEPTPSPQPPSSSGSPASQLSGLPSVGTGDAASPGPTWLAAPPPVRYRARSSAAAAAMPSPFQPQASSPPSVDSDKRRSPVQLRIFSPFGRRSPAASARQGVSSPLGGSSPVLSSGNLPFFVQQQQLPSPTAKKPSLNLRVLIVDDGIRLVGDQQTYVQVLVHLLKKLGVQPKNIILMQLPSENGIRRCENGVFAENTLQQAASTIETINPDFAFIDYSMEPFAGPMLIAEMSDRVKKSTTFVGWTSENQDVTVTKDFETQGVVNVFPKDIKQDILGEILQNTQQQKEWSVVVMEEQRRHEEDTRYYSPSL